MEREDMILNLHGGESFQPPFLGRSETLNTPFKR